jgi:fumarate reductase flavoprotein subunit
MVHEWVEWSSHAMLTNTIRSGLGNTHYIRLNNEGTAITNPFIQPGHYGYFIFNQTTMDSRPMLETYYNRGIVTKGDTAGELAEKLQIAETFKTPFTNAVNALGTTGSYYAIKYSHGVHYCMGGLKINTDTQVINTNNQVIPGLYAAGEVTGGVHGDTRRDGTAVTDTIVFGRQTGIKAAEYARTQGSLPVWLPPTESPGSSVNGNFNKSNGTYTGTANGYNGVITVKVIVANKSITQIVVLPNDETDIKFLPVVDTLIPSIIRTQSFEVDMITGATYSSLGVINAVKNALGL